MPKTKNQHYVPRFYLKNFSSNGKSLNFIHLQNGKIVIGDSIKNQCSEDYFYGNTIPIEKAFGEIETSSSVLIKKIINENYVRLAKTQEHSLLQLFVVTLHSRTKYKSEELNEIADKMAKSLLELHPDVDKNLLDKVEIKLDFPLHYPILTSLTRYHLAQDLLIHLFINESKSNFITSDHPVIYYNKWTEEIKDYGSVGLASKGLLIFLPLSPKKLLLLYDGSVYKIGNKRDSVSTLNDTKEVDNINLLQWLKCNNNIYFYSIDEQMKIKRDYDLNIRLRQQSKVKHQEIKNADGSKIFGAYSSKLKMSLKINTIKIRKQAKQYQTNEKISAIRNPKLLELVNEFCEHIKTKKYSSLEWNKFLEDKVA